MKTPKDMYEDARNWAKKKALGNVNATDNRGDCRLIQAIRKGQHGKLLRLLENGADPNLKGNGNNTPLHVAIHHRQHDCVATLLGFEADANLRNRLGHTPLMDACLHGDTRAVGLLLHYGANPNIADFQGETPIFILKSNLLHIADQLLQAKADINRKNINGDTPLHRIAGNLDAIRRGFLRTYLSAGANPDAANAAGHTPFALALDLAANHLGVEDALVQMLYHGASPLTRGAQSRRTVLDHAILRDNFNLVRTATAKGSFEKLSPLRDDRYQRVIQALAASADTTMIHTVIGRASSTKPDETRAHLSAILHAYLLLHEESAKKGALPEKARTFVAHMLANGANPDVRDSEGRAFLHHAAAANDLRMIEVLLNAKADVNLLANDGYSPLMDALAKQHLAATDYLLDGGADPNQANRTGWTLLDHLARNGDRDSPFVQRLIVAGGHYSKQLPANHVAPAQPPKPQAPHTHTIIIKDSTAVDLRGKTKRPKP